MRIPIIASQYNSLVVHALTAGATDFLAAQGVAIETYQVPGAFELPLLAQWLLTHPHPSPIDGLVAIGAIIEGETAHFQWVCQHAIGGLSQLILAHSTPIGLGILTTPNLSSALERAGGKHGNKGREAAEAVWQSCQLKKKLGLTGASRG